MSGDTAARPFKTRDSAGREGTDADGIVVLGACDQHPPAVVKLECLQGAIHRIDEPQVRNPFAGIHRALAVEVESAGRDGRHLAHPVRRKGDVRGLGVVRHLLAAPSGEIRNQDVFAKMQLRLVDDPQSAGTADLVMVGTSDSSTEHRPRQRMGHRRSRMRVKNPIDDFGHAMGGRVEHVLIGGPRRAGSRLGVASGRGHGAHSGSCAGVCRHCPRLETHRMRAVTRLARAP